MRARALCPVRGSHQQLQVRPRGWSSFSVTPVSVAPGGSGRPVGRQFWTLLFPKTCWNPGEGGASGPPTHPSGAHRARSAREGREGTGAPQANRASDPFMSPSPRQPLGRWWVVPPLMEEDTSCGGFLVSGRGRLPREPPESRLLPGQRPRPQRPREGSWLQAAANATCSVPSARDWRKLSPRGSWPSLVRGHRPSHPPLSVRILEDRSHFSQNQDITKRSFP